MTLGVSQGGRPPTARCGPVTGPGGEAIAGWAHLAVPMGVTIVVENDVHVRHTVARTAEGAVNLTKADRN